MRKQEAQQQKGEGLGSNYLDGVIGGANNTINGIKSSFTLDGYLVGLVNTYSFGGTLGQSIFNLIQNIPNYTENDYAYGAGFLTEKVFEVLVLKKVSQINLFGANGGYGFQVGRTEFMYKRPTVGGGTIFSYKSPTGGKFRLDYHGLPSLNRGNTLHFHTNYGGLSISPHRSLSPLNFGRPIK